jgi:PPK2 family polyphosphate:nucleotide phosphotransferase
MSNDKSEKKSDKQVKAKEDAKSNIKAAEKELAQAEENTAKAQEKLLAKQLWPWQPPLNDGSSAPSKACSMTDFDPGAKPFSSADKQQDKLNVQALADRIDALQNLFYADKRYKLLVILQGTDTSGKDGTLRDLFNRVSPLGVHTVGWKAPTENERAHDYLWRIHQQVPRAGDMVLFNRSHYEEVLVPVVQGSLSAEQTAQRYAHINDFERMLSQTGTVILKFMLHISFQEQRERLQERIDDSSKNWKFSMDDLTARKLFVPYQKAYADLLNATSTPWAPWTVVPADSKTHRNLMVGTLICDALEKLDLRFPPADPALKGIKVV